MCKEQVPFLKHLKLPVQYIVYNLHQAEGWWKKLVFEEPVQPLHRWL